MDKPVTELLRALAEETVKITAQETEISYESLLSYLERRSEYFRIFQAHDWTDAEKVQCASYVEQILAGDPILTQRMNHFKREAAKELEQIYGARKQQAGYEHQAQLQYPVESIFFDQKK